MNNKVVLEWAYEPITYVEEPYEIPGFNYVIYVGNGKAKAIFESQDIYDGDIIEIIHSVLEYSFLSMSLETGESWKLGKLSVSELLSDGSRAFYMSTFGQCDQSKAIIKDVIKEKGEEGKKIRCLDTRTETIEEREKRIIETTEEINKRKIEENPELYAKKCRSRELHYKHKDNPTLKIIMEIYRAACQTEDTKNKIFLFSDIRDAIEQRLGKKGQTAIDTLKESNNSENVGEDWKKLGKLANSTKFGRHTGEIRVKLEQISGKEVNPKEEEANQKFLELNSLELPEVLKDLDECARKLIQYYLNYLENNPQ